MAVTFTSDFTGLSPLDSVWDNAAYVPYVSPSYQVIDGWGCNYGPAFTCSFGNLSKLLTPAYPTMLLAGTVRGRVAIIPAPLVSKGLIYLKSPNDSNGYCTGLFSGFLDVLASGALTFSIYKQTDGGASPHVYTSASGVFVFDGSQQAIQLSVEFPDAKSVDFNVVLNNVSVLSGSYTSATSWDGTGCGVGASVPGFRELQVYADKFRFGNPSMFAWSYVEFDTAASITTFSPCPVVTTLTTSSCSAFIPPDPPPTGFEVDVECSTPIVLIGDGNWQLQRFDVKPREEESA